MIAAGKKVIVPILVLWKQSGGSIAPLAQFSGEPFCGGLPSLVIIKRQTDGLDAWVLLQYPEHCLSTCAAKRHVALALPVLRVQADIGQQIDGGLENEQVLTGACMVEAVLRQTAFYIDPKGPAFEIGASHMGMTGNAVLVETDEHGVMMIRFFVKRSCVGEMLDDRSVDSTAFHEVSKQAAHILIPWRQDERRWREVFFFIGCWISSTVFSVQQQFHGFLIAETVLTLHKADGTAPHRDSVIEPLAAPNRDAVVTIQTLVPAGRKEPFSATAEEFHQVYRVGPLLLLVGKWNIGHGKKTFQKCIA